MRGLEKRQIHAEQVIAETDPRNRETDRLPFVGISGDAPAGRQWEENEKTACF